MPSIVHQAKLKTITAVGGDWWRVSVEKDVSRNESKTVVFVCILGSCVIIGYSLK